MPRSNCSKHPNPIFITSVNFFITYSYPSFRGYRVMLYARHHLFRGMNHSLLITAFIAFIAFTVERIFVIQTVESERKSKNPIIYFNLILSIPYAILLLHVHY